MAACHNDALRDFLLGVLLPAVAECCHLTRSQSHNLWLESNNWWGLLAPAGTPAVAVRRLESVISRVLSARDMKTKFASQGAEVLNLGSLAYAKFLKAEAAKWSKVVRDAGIKAE